MKQSIAADVIPYLGLFASVVVAIGAFAGIFAGFVYQEFARRRAYRAQVLSDADAAIAAVMAASHPITAVNEPTWSLDADERAAIQKELETAATRDIAHASTSAMSALARASAIAPDLREFVDGGPRHILAGATAISGILVEARKRGRH
ncbi:hypothetical protein [uncultured Microbacterium sp.]|uniref:hypothetical protein n=1 Tax=uncultured Microbacterium sp. TaxID=191216 RepID=UPI0025EFA20F|nr:hypothetical protein [uncultured Microbacterium sp.]